ncbi:hypothetical protein PQX77_017372 [Marasmius sp. AFHP31]|nr:hypothetical protein PQX77_017372 [Marasmius sp. AFHP31]
MPAGEQADYTSFLDAACCAPNLKSITIAESTIQFYRPCLLNLSSWESRTALKLENCEVHDPSSLRSVLERAGNLATLHIINTRIGKFRSPIQPSNLPNIRTLSVGRTAIHFLDTLTLPFVRRLNLSTSSKDLSTFWLQDEQTTRFLRSVGTNVEVLTITGRVSNEFVQWVVSSSDDCFPNLESLTVRDHDPAHLSSSIASWNHVPFGLEPFLTSVLDAAGRRQGLKALMLGVYMNGRPVHTNDRLMKCIGALREGGVTVELEYLDDRSSTILDRLGKLLSGHQSGIGQFSIWGTREMSSEMPAVHTILDIVEKHLNERCLTKEVTKAVIVPLTLSINIIWTYRYTQAPWMRSTMMTAAYRTPRRPPSESESRMKKRANEILRQLNILELGAGG